VEETFQRLFVPRRSARGMATRVKVKYLGNGTAGQFKKGQILEAEYLKNPKTKKALCIKDEDGEGYAYPAKWFEIIDFDQGQKTESFLSSMYQTDSHRIHKDIWSLLPLCPTLRFHAHSMSRIFHIHLSVRQHLAGHMNMLWTPQGRQR
jgi:hypothetical protein